MEIEMAGDRPRRSNDPRTAAEAAFKSATTKPADVEPPKAAVPGVRELISLRIDQATLQHFQSGGPGWQDRINDALRKLVGDGRA
jgi:uncharacterized protein (DUF4415 family)